MSGVPSVDLYSVVGVVLPLAGVVTLCTVAAFGVGGSLPWHVLARDTAFGIACVLVGGVCLRHRRRRPLR